MHMHDINQIQSAETYKPLADIESTELEPGTEVASLETRSVDDAMDVAIENKQAENKINKTDSKNTETIVEPKTTNLTIVEPKTPNLTKMFSKLQDVGNSLAKMGDNFAKLIGLKSLAKGVLNALGVRGGHILSEEDFVKEEPAAVSPEVRGDVEAKMKATPPIDKNFTKNKTILEQREAHVAAKTYLKENLEKIGASVSFVSSKPINKSKVELNYQNVKINKKDLDSKVFSWKVTNGVKEDIQRDGKREDNSVVIYAVASQYNGCEEKKKATFKPGEAVEHYKSDRTQGPQAQLAFDPRHFD